MRDKKTVSKQIGENVAPISRWVFTLICSLIVGSIFGGILVKIIRILPFFKEGSYLAPLEGLIEGIASFAGIYLAFMIFLRCFCKTKMRDFLFGAGRKADIKETLRIGGLFVVGTVLSSLISVKTISFDLTDGKLWFINVVFCVLFLWLQTTTEELFFRGLFLRCIHGNEVPSMKDKKGLSVAVISSLIFMVLHFSNPEVSTRFGINAFCMGLGYFISGFTMYIYNLYIGGMEGGILVHLINNFICFTILRDEVTVMPTPTLFVNAGQGNVGVITLVTLVLMNVPAMVYVFIKQKQRNRVLLQSSY